jgi:hypothetical protein
MPTNVFETWLLQRDKGMVTGQELYGMFSKHLTFHPEDAVQAFDALRRHPDENVREIGRGLEGELQRRESRVRDIDQLRRISPLQPGVRLVLSGGYSSPHWWLSGNACYRATFVDFVRRGADNMPAVLIKLQDSIDLTEYSGRRHQGQYALVSLLYLSNWEEEGTVTVHIVDKPPEDPVAFYATHPFGTEIEAHATYAIADANADPS